VRRSAAGFLATMVLTAGVGRSQMPLHYVAITPPESVKSENVFIRYILAGEELGGLVQPRPGVSVYVIGTTRGDSSAAGIKAVLYAPGCGIQTLDISLSNSDNPQYPFACLPLGSIGIAGKLVQTERLSGHEVKIQAKYVARWAQAFLGLGDILVSIPVGDVVFLSAENTFRISVPDLVRDPLAGAADHPGEIQIWAGDKSTGDDIGQLIPAGHPAFKTRMGGLKIQGEYPRETVFAPCALPHSLVLIRRDGFRIRDFNDPCDR
jgi:hypothetical protein